MKKLLLLAASAALVACSENPTQPLGSSLRPPGLTVLTPSGNDLLSCWNGSARKAYDIAHGGVDFDGDCTLSADHKKGVLDNHGPDTDGDYAAVYSDDINPYGEFLTNITELSYSYKSLMVPAQLPQPGELSYNIPIDLNNDGATDKVAYVDAFYCGKKSSATVNIVTSTGCGITYDGTQYPNWAAFIAAPALQFAKVSYLDLYIFIISERVGDPYPQGRSTKWEISNVKFGKTGLVCFDGPSDFTAQAGDCTLGKDFKTVTLDNLTFDSDGGYAGVWSRETTGYGLFLSAIKDLTIKFSGLAAPETGELTYNIPISNNFTGSTDFWAVVDFANCLGTLGGNGVRTVNITTNSACQVKVGLSTYANWAVFAAAWPNAKTATDHHSPPTYYADRTNWMTLISNRDPLGDATRWTVYDIKWGAKK